MKTLKRIFSGGQRGVDLSALAAAHDIGLETGGWAPLNWKTKNGPRPELAKLNLLQSDSDNYKIRTYLNVKDTDGTLILAYDFNSSGIRCTKKAIDFYQKPFFECNLNDLPFIFDVTDWLDTNEIVILNVAGNSGRTKKEGTKIFIESRKYLTNVFRAYNGG